MDFLSLVPFTALFITCIYFCSSPITRLREMNTRKVGDRLIITNIQLRRFHAVRVRSFFPGVIANFPQATFLYFFTRHTCNIITIFSSDWTSPAGYIILSWVNSCVWPYSILQIFQGCCYCGFPYKAGGMPAGWAPPVQQQGNLLLISS
jgi:hypothetical protein